jgi:hypothetical protein
MSALGIGRKRRNGATSFFFADPLESEPFEQFPDPYCLSVSATFHARIRHETPYPEAGGYARRPPGVAQAAGL